jgi:hypothetical protein
MNATTARLDAMLTAKTGAVVTRPTTDVARRRPASTRLTATSRTAPSTSRTGATTDPTQPGSDETTWNAFAGQSVPQLVHGVAAG